MSLVLKNPHSVLAAIEARPRDVVEVRLWSGKPSPGWEEVVNAAAENRVPVVRGGGTSGGGRRRRRDGEDARRTPSAEATVKPRGDVSLAALFQTPSAADRETDEPESERFGLWLALDQIQDPHNVGAIFRTAAFFGVRGIVVTKDRSAPLAGTVYDVASGGLECVPFSEQTNLARTLDAAKEAGLWVLGTSEHAELDLADVEVDRDWLVVLGNEEKGLRRLTAERCDTLCGITPRGGVTSLNVSVAAAVLVSRLSR